MNHFKYLAHYPKSLLEEVAHMIENKTLGAYLVKRYPAAHEMQSDKALYDFTQEIKGAFLKNAPPLSKVTYDGKVSVVLEALGAHTFVSRVQGGRLKAKNEIKIATLFKQVPEPFLRMIVVHELAHFKEKEHNKAFYKLCMHMEPSYGQLEFDTRLYMTHVDLFGKLWERSIDAR